MGAKWTKPKLALRHIICGGSASETEEENRAPPQPSSTTPEFLGSDFSMITSTAAGPVSNSFGIKMSKSGSKTSAKVSCAICLDGIKSGHGQAIFTAECSHTFHFQCIASNVRHGNHVCPICRANWNELPFPNPQSFNHSHCGARVSPADWPPSGSDSVLLNRQHNLARPSQSSEPDIFDDDEPLNLQPSIVDNQRHGCVSRVKVETETEFLSIPQSVSAEQFAVLIHLKAPSASVTHIPSRDEEASSGTPHAARAPIDLVTVLDVSSSMSGTKLSLLKRAMGFVIQNLGPSDRLSVIAFSSTARRLFNLRKMSDSGRQQALQSVNALVASGGTNIFDGLSKAAKVIQERKEKNLICSIILLSDGQDSYNLPDNSGGSLSLAQSLLPSSVWDGFGHQLPVHTFGFGADHDAAALHSISEVTGGTFSFIEAQGVIQDAFAQCIGGLLSVVVQDMHVKVDCVYPGVELGEIKSGSYVNHVADDKQTGLINVGDMYADEERAFLVSVNIPPAHEHMSLLKVSCSYQDAISMESVCLPIEEVKLLRLDSVETQTISIKVDRQRNRLCAAEAMADARAAAERGELSEAVSILEKFRTILLESFAGQAGDEMCMALDTELRGMQERMANHQRYESSGRAYMLSGLSSHSWQRATARGDSTEITTSILAYHTPSMVEMLGRSQVLATPPRRLILPDRLSMSAIQQPSPSS